MAMSREPRAASRELRAESREPRARRRGRADPLLVERGLCGSRQEGSRLIMAGKGPTATGRVEKPGTLLPAETPLEVVGPPHPFVSRGGVKLRHALDVFRLDPRGRA